MAVGAAEDGLVEQAVEQAAGAVGAVEQAGGA